MLVFVEFFFFSSFCVWYYYFSAGFLSALALIYRVWVFGERAGESVGVLRFALTPN